MSVQVSLPDELVAQIDVKTADRVAFVTEAVLKLLHESHDANLVEVDRINELADELNREAEDALEYQVIS